MVARKLFSALDNLTACDSLGLAYQMEIVIHDQEAYQEIVTRYDQAGEPYQTPVTHFRVLDVPVTMRVEFC